MSIRSEAMPYRAGLSGNLQELLRKNGMTAQIALEGDKFALYVQGHDSPMLRYEISEQQMRALADGGTNYSNKRHTRPSTVLSARTLTCHLLT